MAENFDLKTVVNHLANGNLGELCIVCLLPVTKYNFENIFSSICKQDEEYCIADVLREVCQWKFSETEYYNVCCSCFTHASNAYKFYLQTKRSREILTFYTNQLISNIDSLALDSDDNNHILCIPLPIVETETPGFDFDIQGIGSRKMEDAYKKIELQEKETALNIKCDDVREGDTIVIVEDGVKVSYIKRNGKFYLVDSDDEDMLMIINEKKRKKRERMEYISCIYCPVKYKFLSLMKDHLKKCHDKDNIYYCKVCKLITVDKDNYKEHMAVHDIEYPCSKCNATFKKQETLATHMKTHDRYTECIASFDEFQSTSGHICETCGELFDSEKALEQHFSDKHVKNYTCHYCGRMYRIEVSLELHLKKHEKYMKSAKQQKGKKSKANSEKENNSNTKPRSVCGVCGKTFVDDRSLRWHQQLHDNERPFTCDVCGRGFISVNRRNQHALCAHTPPARRCPLCPALFHMRSMVTSHLKKVHLNKTQKRRKRVAKPKHVFWRTRAVPVPELSVAVQAAVLDLQGGGGGEALYTKQEPVTDQNPTSSFTTQQFYKDQDLPTEIMTQDQYYVEFTEMSEVTGL